MALSSKNSEKSDAESMNFCLTGRCGASGGGTHGGHVSKTQSIRKAGFDIARGCTIRAVVTKARPNRSSNHRPKKRQLLRRYSRGAAHLCKRGLLCRSNCSIAVDRATELALQLASLMERPSIRVAVGDARRAAAETGETIDDFGSVRGLDWVRRPSTPDQHGTRAKPVQRRRKPARAGQTRNDLNAALEHLVPAYREANRNFAAMSRQINGMDAARDLDRAYSPVALNCGTTAKEQGAAHMKAMRNAQEFAGTCEADRPCRSCRCAATLRQSDRLRVGITPQEAAKIFGTPGKHVASVGAQSVDMRTYQWANTDGSNATVTFMNDRLVAKAQFGLR
jgi:hypothetical protein